MQITAEDRQRCVRYLLGGMSTEQMEEFEDRYFLNQKFFEFLQVVEDELIARYLRRDLSADELQRFESYYLTSAERRQKVDFAIALRQSVARVPVARPSIAEKLRGWLASPAFRYSAVTAIAIAAGMFSTVRMVQLQQRLNQQALSSGNQIQQFERQLTQERALREKLQTSLRSGKVRTTILTPPSRSSGAQETVIATADAALIELRLSLQGKPAAATYRVRLKTTSQEEVFSQVIQSDQPVSPVVTIPAALLTEAYYFLELEAAGPRDEFSPLSTYTFAVKPK